MNTKSYKKYQDESYNALMDQEYGKSTALMEKAHNRKYSVAVGSVG